jgi:putative ubiquitin-RnfH superfamily antitoxin RatB of RatAB toxin-antitoxin module
MDKNEAITVELIYIKPDSQNSLILKIPQGSNISQVIKRSGLLQRFPEIDLAVNKVGIFSKIKPLDYVLNNGDRLEIYRPLLVDPKEARRRRVQKQQS